MAHVPRFPNLRLPTAIVLEPFPNSRVFSMTIAAETLVTTHKSGIRLFRERVLPAVDAPRAGSGPSPPSAPRTLTDGPGSGLWELQEKRDDLSLHDAYLCTSMQPVLAEDQLLVSKFSRYVCVAAGNDRTGHSVNVLSTTAHFTLHHELHRMNQVVCLYAAQIALEPLQEERLRPFVVSVDEIGEIVLYDVERDAAVKLQRCPALLSLPPPCAQQQKQQQQQQPQPPSSSTALEESHVPISGGPPLARSAVEEPHCTHGKRKTCTTTTTTRNATVTATPRRTGCGEGEDASCDPEEYEQRVLEQLQQPNVVLENYRLDRGLATNVVLVGPCVELCHRCHNVFSIPASSTGRSPGSGPAASSYTAMSLFVSSRAKDVEQSEDTAATTAETGTKSRGVGSSSSGGGGGDAELHVTFLRILLSPHRAVVLHDLDVLWESAPADVCDAGIAMSVRPYRIGRPMTMLMARPRLRWWSLSGCTGQLLQLRRVYQDSDGNGLGTRSQREFFVRYLPLGRHVLDNDPTRSWFCAAAVTDDDTVLLLGRADRSTTASQETVEAPAEVVERQVLEAWLDEVETKPPSAEDHTDKGKEKREDNADKAEAAAMSRETNAVEGRQGYRNSTVAVSKGPRFVALANDYVVLMELYSAAHSIIIEAAQAAVPASVAGNGSSVAAVRRGVLGVLPVLNTNTLLLFMSDEETVLRVRLPFTSTIQTTTLKDQSGREGLPLSPQPTLPTSSQQTAQATNASTKPAESAVTSSLVGGLWGMSKGLASTSTWLSAVDQWSSVLKGARESSPTSSSSPARPAADPTKAATNMAEAPAAVQGDALKANTAAATGAAAASGGNGHGWAFSALHTTASASTASRARSNANEVGAAVPSESETAYSFSIVRPLAAMMMHLTGEDKEDEDDNAPPPAQLPRVLLPPTQPVQPPQGPAAAAAAERASLSPHPQPLPRQPSPQPRRGASEEGDTSMEGTWPSRSDGSGGTPSRSSATRSESSSSRAKHSRTRLSRRRRPVEAIDVTVHSSHSRRAHHHSERHKALAREEEEHSPCDDSNESAPVPTARSSYLEEQLRRVLPAEVVTDNTRSSDQTVAHDTNVEEEGRRMLLENAVTHLVEVEEPLARNAIRYAWEDGHNLLYFNGTTEHDALEEAAAVEKTNREAQLAAERAVFQRYVMADIGRGLCSARFLHAFKAIRDERQRNHNKRGMFDFATYFTTRQVPRQLVDLQERDKCNYELADLRLNQADELAALPALLEEIVFYQNEEKETGKGGKSKKQWAPHRTFPYDDEEGNTVDLALWNRQADAFYATAYEWASESDSAAMRKVLADGEANRRLRKGATASREPPPSSVKVMVSRELRGWVVGPWMYAVRWPSSSEVLAGTFEWSVTETPATVVRRRRLSRYRVNLRVKKEREKLQADHATQLDLLREELGL